MSKFESEPSDFISDHFIHHFLYGKEIKDFEQMMKEEELIDILSTKEDIYWNDLMKS